MDVTVIKLPKSRITEANKDIPDAQLRKRQKKPGQHPRFVSSIKQRSVQFMPLETLIPTNFSLS